MNSGLSDQAVRVLRLADRRLRATAADDVHEMCAIVRRSASALVPVDAFYVGLFHRNDTLVMPYVFSANRELNADSSCYGQGGLSHWIRSSGRAYRFGHDAGRLCHAGAPLDDGPLTQDVVAVPMYDLDERTVIGVVNAQSLGPDAFGDTFVTALEWLAQALALRLELGDQKALRSKLYRKFPELDSGRLTSPVDLVHAATERMERVAVGMGVLQSQVSAMDAAGMSAGLEALQIECRRAGAELAVMAVRTPDAIPHDHGIALTAREQQIAELIATEALSNVLIARRLTISEKTVKAHVGNILQKLHLHQRGELSWMWGTQHD